MRVLAVREMGGIHPPVCQVQTLSTHQILQQRMPEGRLGQSPLLVRRRRRQSGGRGGRQRQASPPSSPPLTPPSPLICVGSRKGLRSAHESSLGSIATAFSSVSSTCLCVWEPQQRHERKESKSRPPLTTTRSPRWSPRSDHGATAFRYYYSSIWTEEGPVSGRASKLLLAFSAGWSDPGLMDMSTLWTTTLA